MRRLFLLLLALCGCLNQTPPSLAPDAVDENLKWFWIHGDSADDATLIDAASKLSVSGKADTRTSPLKGQMRQRLESGDLANVGLEGNDPSTARGLIVVNLFDCTLAKLETILTSREQMTQYPDVYTAYDRTYTRDAEAFAGGSSNLVSWDVAGTVSLPLGDIYQSNIKGGLRRVVAPAESATRGNFLIARTWLTAPATFMNPNTTSYFRQDYQIEVFWEQSPGRVFHGYGMWRDIKTYDLTIEDNGFLNIVLDNLVKWDTRTAELCAQP